MDKELIAVPDNSDASLVMPVMNLAIAKERRTQLVNFVSAIMVRDTDFGVIPGTDKPTLLKPGAEKLTTFFGLSKRFEVIDREEDWTGAFKNNEPFFYYLYRCRLFRGDILIAEADGSCNSFEAKYRYRKSERLCPKCGKANIRKSKNDGGWYCWAKTGGCGETFKKGDQSIEAQQVGRVPNPDIADQVNTIQKMAQKRALIAATLLAVNASEFFTQDVEDLIDVDPEPVIVEQDKPAKATEPAHNPPANGGTKPYRFPSKAAEEFYNEVQAATNNYYTGPFHLMQTLGGQWFNFGDKNLWEERLDFATSHARKARDAEQPGLAGVETAVEAKAYSED